MIHQSWSEAPEATEIGRRALLGSALGSLLMLAACQRTEPDPAQANLPKTLLHAPAHVAASPLAIEVWKSPYCGCCKLWVRHLEAHEFTVTAYDVSDTAAMRSQLGMPANFGSCHSARIAGYIIEGHVPAADIKRLLAEKPDVIGLAVPGMPIGSPGMEQGDSRDKYDVLLVLRNGRSRVFQSHS